MQRRWTKQIAGLNNVDYAARLNQLKLFSIQGRMFRADLVKLWKAFNAEVDVGLRENLRDRFMVQQGAIDLNYLCHYVEQTFEGGF